MEILIGGLALWLIARLLGWISQVHDAAATTQDAAHDLKCELAERVKDEPEEDWRRYGLDKHALLRDCRDHRHL